MTYNSDSKLILLNLALFATGMNSRRLLYRLFRYPLFPGTSTAFALAAVAPVPLDRPADSTLGVTIPPAPSLVAGRAGSVAAVVQLIAASAGIAAGAVESFAFVFAIPTFPLVVAHTVTTLALPVTVSVAVAVAILIVRPFAICLGPAAVCFVSVRFWTAAATSVATMAVAVAVVVVPSAVSRVTILIRVFLFLLEAANDFVKGSLPEVVGFQGSVLFILLHPRLHLIPGVGNAHRWLEMLDAGTECIKGTSLVTISGMLLLFAAPDGLLLNSVE